MRESVCWIEQKRCEGPYLERADTTSLRVDSNKNARSLDASLQLVSFTIISLFPIWGAGTQSVRLWVCTWGIDSGSTVSNNRLCSWKDKPHCTTVTHSDNVSQLAVYSRRWTMSATDGSYLAMLFSLKHILIVDITHAVNQAFCRCCQTQGTEDQKEDPCGITQEMLLSQGIKLGQTCPECEHSFGSHANRESCCDFTYAYQYRF